MHEIVAREPNAGARRVADDAEREHADDYGGIFHHRVGRVDQVTEPVLAGDHFGCHEREPRHANRDLKPGEDERHRAGDDHMPENLPPFSAEAVGGADVGDVDRFDAEHGVQGGGVERGEVGEEDDGSFRPFEHDDGERHPRERRDRAQKLENREHVFLERSRPTQE